MARVGHPKARGARWRCHKEAAGSARQEHQPRPKDARATLYDHFRVDDLKYDFAEARIDQKRRLSRSSNRSPGPSAAAAARRRLAV